MEGLKIREAGGQSVIQGLLIEQFFASNSSKIWGEQMPPLLPWFRRHCEDLYVLIKMCELLLFWNVVINFFVHN